MIFGFSMEKYHRHGWWCWLFSIFHFLLNYFHRKTLTNIHAHTRIPLLFLTIISLLTIFLEQIWCIVNGKIIRSHVRACCAWKFKWHIVSVSKPFVCTWMVEFLCEVALISTRKRESSKWKWNEWEHFPSCWSFVKKKKQKKAEKLLCT